MEHRASRRRLPWARRAVADGERPVAFDPHELSGLFTPPRWLQDLGATAWLGVGITLLVVGAVWLLSLTHTIVTPLLAAGVVAAVTAPAVAWAERRGLRRGLASALVLVLLAAVAVGVIVATLVGVTSQLGDLRGQLADARGAVSGWLSDLGVDDGTARDATGDVSATVRSAAETLLGGIAGGIQALSSLVVFLSLTALSLFFLLKDGRTIRGWAERHMRVSERVAHQMTGRVLQALRGYFVGVTIVAAFNAVVVTAGALLLDVPEVGAIAVVTFLGAYIPYLGAWSAGAFAVLVALGGAGTDAAVGMIVIQLLANGILQQLVQPIAYGAALGIHPLAVLVVTIAGGALFGAVGLILAAPLASAATRIASDLAQNAPADAERPAGAGGERGPAPEPGAARDTTEPAAAVPQPAPQPEPGAW